MLLNEIAYLGPEGTFAHIVAMKRFRHHPLVPQRTVSDVFSYVRAKSDRCGIVPIENSSGGTIHATVDELIDRTRGIAIQEQLSIRVRLALLGHKQKPVRVVYSHFAPFHHCDAWLNEHFPNVERKEVSSTGAAVKLASSEMDAAAIGTKQAATLYGLDVLRFPIEQDIANVTEFFAVGHPIKDSRNSTKTSLVVSLKDSPGSLCAFLEPFKEAKINLSRIVSRNVIGRPNEYVFFVDIVGTEKQPAVAKALKAAQRGALYIHRVGTYSVHPQYTS
jgi:prephenate dehydratase